MARLVGLSSMIDLPLR